MPAEPTFQYRYSSGTGFSSSTCSPSSLKHYAPPSAVTLTFHFLRSAGSGAHRGDPGSGTGNGWENRGKTISPRMPGEPLLFCWGARLVNIQKGLPPLRSRWPITGQSCGKSRGWTASRGFLGRSSVRECGNLVVARLLVSSFSCASLFVAFAWVVAGFLRF